MLYQFIYANSGNSSNALLQLYAMKKLDYTGTIYAATCIARGKEQALRRRGADLVKRGADCVDAENKAKWITQVRGHLVRPRRSEVTAQTTTRTSVRGHRVACRTHKSEVITRFKARFS